MKNHGMTTRRMTRVALAAVVSVASVTGCAPPPTSPGGISCGQGSANVEVTPGFTQELRPNTMTLGQPSTLADCVDDTGTGINSARLKHLTVAFDSIGCFSPPETHGDGNATIQWSDRTTSNAVAEVSLGSPLAGVLHLTVTSGHFAGMTGSSNFSAFPAQGDCASGITLESVHLDGIALAPV